MTKKGRTALIYAAKVFVLLVLDVLTILCLVFPLEKMRGHLYISVLANILAVLFIVNLFCLSYGVLRRTLYKRTAGVVVSVTLFYYLFSVLFTYWTKPWITAKWYGFSALIAFVVYIFCCMSLRRSDAENHSRTQKNIRPEDMQMLLMQLQNCLYELQPCLETRQYASLSRALGGLREWLEFSTPFGRSRQPVIQDMEQQVYRKTRSVLERIHRLPHVKNRGDTAENLISDIFAVTELLKSRERLQVG